MIRLTVDICLAVFLLLVMSKQATGEKLHEWIGLVLTAAFLFHQILNIKWYRSLFSGKGKWTAFRILTAAADILLLISFVLSALSGMSMSVYSFPFMYGIIGNMLSRRLHLAFSHWCLILAAFHFGMHISAIENRYMKRERARSIFAVLFTCAAGIGVYAFLRNRIPSYIFFTAAFAIFEPGKPKVLVLLEYLSVFILCAFAGYISAVQSSASGRKDGTA